MLFTIYSDKDLNDVKRVAIGSVIALQSSSVYCTKFYTPETDCFPANDDASFGQEILNIAMAQVEPKVQPVCVGNDVGRESGTLVCIHGQILAFSAKLTCRYPIDHLRGYGGTNGPSISRLVPLLTVVRQIKFWEERQF